MKTETLSADTKELVLLFIEALNDEDFENARKYLNKDFTFKGVMGSRDGADAYMQDMQKMKFKYKIKKAVADDHDVSILYDFTQGGVTLPGCAWYHVADHKIKSLTVIFDPRPLLDKASKN